MFVITNKGIYDLVVKFRICVAMTNRVPDIKAMTNVNSFLASRIFAYLNLLRYASKSLRIELDTPTISTRGAKENMNAGTPSRYLNSCHHEEFC